MDIKRTASWAVALLFAVLASSEVLQARGDQRGQTASPINVPLAPTQPAKWQYFFWEVNGADIGAYQYHKSGDLNQAGMQGWELVAILPESSHVNSALKQTYFSSILIFKKPL